MSRRDRKNKDKNNKPTAPKQSVVTSAMYSDAQSALKESAEALASIPKNEVDVSAISETYATDGTIESADITKCTADLLRSVKILNATQRKYEELKAEHENVKKEWETAKAKEEAEIGKMKEEANEEIEAIKGEAIAERDALKAERKRYAEKELKLIEDEKNAIEGDHTGIIERLIDAFKANREQVITAAETQMMEQAEITKDYLEKLSKVTAKETQLEVKEKELRTLEKKIKALEIVAKDELESLREEIQQEVEDKFEDALSLANKEVIRYKSRFEKSQKEIDEIKNILETIQSAFGDIDPAEMAVLCNKLKEEIVLLNDELASRPLQDDLLTKQKEVELLTQDLMELRKKFNEQEYLELKKMFDNNDHLIRDYQLRIDEIESAKIREKHLRDTIEDLRRTIKEINENHNKDNAFKSASKYDTGDYQIPLLRTSAPANLTEFISYLQSFMATTLELKYSKDIIKKFIAGLHMSPISILQGISGTGKTSLPKAIAMALTADDDRYSKENGEDELPKASYRVCPIQSGWRDKMDLMGFYNAFEKSYHETEFFNALYLANQPKYQQTLFFIILDEMNLSRPEHYFADFLSKLELDKGQRKIKIDNVPETLSPDCIIGGTINIPENVRFIGTANHDETTLEFAPKTYDRSNVIEMPRNKTQEAIPSLKRRYNISYEWLSKQFKLATDNHKQESEKFETFLKDEELIDLLGDKGIGIGNRFEGQSQRFLSVFVEAGDNTRKDIAKAADHLVTTRLLRTLKDNYDLTPDDLNKFIENYKGIFFRHFHEEPKEAMDLIDNEIKKKGAK